MVYNDMGCPNNVPNSMKMAKNYLEIIHMDEQNFYALTKWPQRKTPQR